NADNGEDDQREIVFHSRQVAEEIAKQQEAPYPQQRTDDVVSEKAPVVHGADAGNEWRKGTNNRYKAGQDNGFAAVFLVKRLGAQQMLAVEPAVIAAEYPRPEIMADRVVQRIASDRCDTEAATQQQQIEIALGGEGAGGEQQRIARQKGHDDEAGFDEYDRKQNRVGLHAVVANQLAQMNIDVQNEIDQILHVIHAGNLSHNSRNKARWSVRVGGMVADSLQRTRAVAVRHFYPRMAPQFP